MRITICSTAIAMTLVACGAPPKTTSKPSDTPTDATALPATELKQSSEDITGIADQWWTDPGSCPEGTKLTGKTPANSEEPAEWQVECVNPETEERSGPFTAWWPNGKKREEGGFENDSAAGVWVLWDESGELVSKQTYKDGELVSDDKLK